LIKLIHPVILFLFFFFFWFFFFFIAAVQDITALLISPTY